MFTIIFIIIFIIILFIMVVLQGLNVKSLVTNSSSYDAEYAFFGLFWADYGDLTVGATF